MGVALARFVSRGGIILFPTFVCWLMRVATKAVVPVFHEAVYYSSQLYYYFIRALPRHTICVCAVHVYVCV